jgi:transcriptional regulator with XRE-family HTH domain
MTGGIPMSIGSKIAQYRKEKDLTQESLAYLLNVTNQAVSKWESDMCCPDINMLPKLADTLDVTIDALFDREARCSVTVQNLPWKDDDTLRVVLYQGHKLLKNSDHAGEFLFVYEGTAKNISSAISVECGDVQGDVDAGAYVECCNVSGNVNAGAYVECCNVGGNVDAGAYVECCNVSGNVDAGIGVCCDDV